MADEVDMANDRAEQDLAKAIAAAQRAIPPGAPGECRLCGELSQRLIGEACAPCRDLYKLP